MARPSTDRFSNCRHSDSVIAGRQVIGIIAIDESFACQMEAQDLETPWENLIRDWAADHSNLRCDQLVADIDGLAKELADEFTALAMGSV
jgi:hypothetical protein